MISGAVKLWLEQEGEAQLCSKCCGLYLQVQPGETGITIYTYCPFISNHSKASTEKEGKKDEKQSCSKFIDLCVLAIQEMEGIKFFFPPHPLLSFFHVPNHQLCFPRGGCFKLFVMAALYSPLCHLPAIDRVIYIINGPQVMLL